MAHGYAAGDPFGDPSRFTRHTGATEVDRFNQWMRSQPWWQAIKGSANGFNDTQKHQLVAALRQQGIAVPDGIHVDDAGNFNQSRTTGDWLKYAAIAGGAAVGGLGLAGIGPLGFLGTAAGGVDPALEGGATLASNLGAASALPTAAAAGMPALAGGSTLASGLGAASAVPGLESSLTVPTAGMLPAGVAPTGAGFGTGATMTTAPRAASLFGVPGSTIFTAGTSLFGNLFGAWMQGHAADKAAQAEAAAAKYAADLQDAASRRAEQFSRESAENAYLNSEAARQGNYGMYAAGQRRLGMLGEMAGFGPREIPAYVGGVDPHYTTAGTPAPGTVGTAAGGAAPDLSGVQAKFNQLFPGETLTPEMLAAHRAELEGMGFTLNPNAAGKITDLSYQGYNIDPIQGAGSGVNKKQWLVTPPGGGASAPRAVAAPAYATPAVPFLSGVNPAPALGYLGSYA